MDKNFETEVLTRLTAIETKLDDYKNIKDKTTEAYNNSLKNKEQIDEINEKIKWITRLISGAIITGVIGILFAYIQK